MGLLEQLSAGTTFSRKTITIPIFYTGISSGSLSTETDTAGTYIILNASSNKKSRIRLYSDSASVVIDNSRSVTDFNINNAVGLNADINLTDNPFFINLDPPVIGTTFLNGQTWYNVSSSIGPTLVTFEVYNIAAQGDSITDRSELRITGSSVPTTGYGVSGSITTKKSFIILSGSATAASRLRLYSTTMNNVPFTEQTRSFGSASVGEPKLIADLMFDTAGFSYKLVPVLEAYSWENDQYSIGTGVLGYQLENKSGGATDITASLYIYSTEE